MMSEHDNDGEFASVVWDTPEDANQSASSRNAEPSTSASGARGNGASSASSSSPAAAVAGGDSNYNAAGTSSSTPAASHQLHRAGSTSSNAAAATSAGPAGTAESSTGRYWIKASVVEPVKMLEGTKDAYVAYNVKGEVRLSFAVHDPEWAPERWRQLTLFAIHNPHSLSVPQFRNLGIRIATIDADT